MTVRSPQTASSQAANGRPARVMLVDDSIVVRSIIERIIESEPGFEIVASVPTAPEALSQLAVQDVDIIVLDLEMPVMHGLAAIPLILDKSPATRIIILSANCEDGGPAAVDALALGAADTLLKPGRGTFAGRFGTTLIERLQALTETAQAERDRPTLRMVPSVQARAVLPQRRIDAIGVGASTGGIMAINAFLGALPDHIDVPIFITQHLPAGFVRYFADQLQRVSARRIHVAEDGMAVQPGAVFLAPGEAHLRIMGLSSGHRIMLDRSPAPSGASPSVDPMLTAIAQCYGPHGCCVMLSGMGKDGLDGARRLKADGGLILAQDLTSSVVWGMPGAVVREGLAEQQGDPAQLAELIADMVVGRATA